MSASEELGGGGLERSVHESLLVVLMRSERVWVLAARLVLEFAFVVFGAEVPTAVLANPCAPLLVLLEQVDVLLLRVFIAVAEGKEVERTRLAQLRLAQDAVLR